MLNCLRQRREFRASQMAKRETEKHHSALPSKRLTPGASYNVELYITNHCSILINTKSSNDSVQKMDSSHLTSASISSLVKLHDLTYSSTKIKCRYFLIRPNCVNWFVDVKHRALIHHLIYQKHKLTNYFITRAEKVPMSINL